MAAQAIKKQQEVEQPPMMDDLLKNIANLKNGDEQFMTNWTILHKVSSIIDNLSYKHPKKAHINVEESLLKAREIESFVEDRKQAAVTIQKMVRGFLNRENYQELLIVYKLKLKYFKLFQQGIDRLVSEKFILRKARETISAFKIQSFFHKIKEGKSESKRQHILFERIKALMIGYKTRRILKSHRITGIKRNIMRLNDQIKSEEQGSDTHHDSQHNLLYQKKLLSQLIEKYMLRGFTELEGDDLSLSPNPGRGRNQYSLRNTRWNRRQAPFRSSSKNMDTLDSSNNAQNDSKNSAQGSKDRSTSRNKLGTSMNNTISLKQSKPNSLNQSRDLSQENTPSLVHPDDRPIKPMGSNTFGGMGGGSTSGFGKQSPYSSQDGKKLKKRLKSQKSKVIKRSGTGEEKVVDENVKNKQSLMNKRMKYDPRKAAKESKKKVKKSVGKKIDDKLADQHLPKKRSPSNKRNRRQRPKRGNSGVLKNGVILEEKNSEDEDSIPQDLKDYLENEEKKDKEQFEENQKPKKKFTYLKRKSKKVQIQKVNWSHIKPKIDAGRNANPDLNNSIDFTPDLINERIAQNRKKKSGFRQRPQRTKKADSRRSTSSRQQKSPSSDVVPESKPKKRLVGSATRQRRLREGGSPKQMSRRSSKRESVKEELPDSEDSEASIQKELESDGMRSQRSPGVHIEFDSIEKKFSSSYLQMFDSIFSLEKDVHPHSMIPYVQEKSHFSQDLVGENFAEVLEHLESEYDYLVSN